MVIEAIRQYKKLSGSTTG